SSGFGYYRRVRQDRQTDARRIKHMSIEKAFAIHAAPEAIFAALTDELDKAAGESDDTFEVLRLNAPESIDLRVTIGGVPCWLTYRLEPTPDHTEVIPVVTPFALKYTLFSFV